ncbi:hypothetical protein [Paenibacillus agricola]|uniref:Uncharacterized protein n=1 Tax=Paenibacillus agricola TaxID=2716264 RepID=A0ABX0J511_9BACL|nr:hypothetical protein [Paenibacillus agricola]NHN31217.1 hypothetical protein [Paenibacillus agricola]
MKHGDKVIFLEEVTTWNGKRCRAKVGETGRIIGLVRGDRISVKPDGKNITIHDVSLSNVKLFK